MVQHVSAKWSLVLLGILMVTGLSATASADISEPKWKRHVPAAAEGENVAVYLSNGDNEIFFNSLPIDSPKVIDELLDVLKNAHGLKRIYWRAPQIDQIIYQGQPRYNSAHHGPWMKWLEHLFGELGTGDHMVRAARERGMEVWGVASLFDHGAQAYVEYPNKGMGPFPTENFIRIEHPEWIPVDRAGITRMPGPICFAYPEARKALVDMYVELVRDKGYTGLSFHTYVENQGPRFDDEFGFNEPIVEEYRKRYGVDIRAEPYDKQKLAELRGEYLTQFFRELSAAFKPMGVKLSVMLDAKTPGNPQYWLAYPNLMLSGRIHIDWRTYAHEGLVDELFVYFNGDPFPTLRQVMKEVKNKGFSFATLSSGGFPAAHKDLEKRGVWRTIAGEYEELEFGYHENQPVTAMEGDDFIAKLSVLAQMGAGTLEADMPRILTALKDESVLVRRRALRLLRTVGERSPEKITPNVIDAIVVALDDEENIVRCTAVNTLSSVGDSSVIPTLFDAIGRHGNPMMQLIAAAPLATLPAERTADLMVGLKHDAPHARIIAIKMASGGMARPETWPLISASTEHENWLVRWNAARALEFIGATDATDRLFALLDDPHPTVRNIAVRNLSYRLRSETMWVGGWHARTIDKLKSMFAKYGQDSTMEDREWAWRAIGLALLRMGPRGKQILEQYQRDTSDPVLAHRAWHALNVVENDNNVVIITEEEAEAQYQRHPSKSGNAESASEAPAEPKWMPYLQENFDALDDQQAAGHEFGNPLTHSGLWRKVNVVKADGANGQCLRVVAGNGIESVAEALRLDFRISEGQLKADFLVQREQPESQLILWLTSSNQWEGNVRIEVGPEGVAGYDADGRRVATELAAEPGVWYHLEIRADLDKRTVSLYHHDGDKVVPLASDIAMPSQLQYDEYNMCVLLPGGPDGAGSLIDSLNYQVTNPFAAK